MEKSKTETIKEILEDPAMPLSHKIAVGLMNDPKKEGLIDKIAKGAKAVLAKASAIIIKTEVEYNSAADLLSACKRGQKTLAETKTDFVKPFKDQVKYIEDRLKPIDYDLKVAEEKIKNSMGIFITQKREAERLEQEKLQKKAEEDAEDQGIPAELVPVQPAPKANLSSGTASVADIWDCEIIDLNLVPDQFIKKELRKSEVLSAARDAEKNGNTIGVTGLRIFKRPNISGRA